MRPRQDGDDDDVVAHSGIPPALWQTWCPFRALQVPGVSAGLDLFGRFKRYGLPNGRGFLDESERDLRTIDLLEWAVRLPLAPVTE